MGAAESQALPAATQESSSSAEYLSTAAARGDRLVPSMHYTELHGAAHQRGLPGELINSVLRGINLLDLVRSDLMYAAALPGGLRSPDAIHLATSIRVESDVLVAYDAELLAAAVDAGLNNLFAGRQ